MLQPLPASENGVLRDRSFLLQLFSLKGIKPIIRTLKGACGADESKTHFDACFKVEDCSKSEIRNSNI